MVISNNHLHALNPAIVPIGSNIQARPASVTAPKVQKMLIKSKNIPRYFVGKNSENKENGTYRV